MSLAPAPGIDSTRLARVAAAIDADIAAGRCDGVAICVARHGRVILERASGYADRAAARVLSLDDVFVSMSIGKQFTNVVVLGCVERGALSLATTVGELLPAFANSAWHGVTVAHLLTHTAGVISAVPSLPPEALGNTAMLAAFAAAHGPEHAPGSAVNYSILAAHAVLAEIVKVVDGGTRSFAAIVERELLQPLGMYNTSLGPRDDLLRRLCPVVARYDEPGLFDPRAIEGLGLLIQTPGCEVAAGGYLTTLQDLHRFTQMLARGGELDGTRVLSPATIALCARNLTAEMPNNIMDYTAAKRGWLPWPAYIGLGFFVRGSALTPGPVGNLCSQRTLCGWGAGSTAFWVDAASGLSFSLLTTGLMEDSEHIQRVQRLSDLVNCALVE
jgi:CubicO group peptidase (beta-lactamase class C family)